MDWETGLIALYVEISEYQKQILWSVCKAPIFTPTLLPKGEGDINKLP
jgi:hypothetical protein